MDSPTAGTKHQVVGRGGLSDEVREKREAILEKKKRGDRLTSEENIEYQREMSRIYQENKRQKRCVCWLRM
jgi:hypothetical protein